MANKMLIDATHPEETRVVVLRGNRVEEFDFESAHRKQLRGNIYLAKVTRVEPSLQAAFVDYGGNRHGFLAFSEIHPDYYQIPVADRQALIDEEQRAQRDADDEVDRRSRRHRNRRRDRPRAPRRRDPCGVRSARDRDGRGRGRRITRRSAIRGGRSRARSSPTAHEPDQGAAAADPGMSGTSPDAAPSQSLRGAARKLADRRTFASPDERRAGRS